MNLDKQLFLEYLLNKMSLTEKIGQMIMIDYRNMQMMTEELEKVLFDYKPGGLILFRDNVTKFRGTSRLISKIKSVNSIPTMVAVDQEGGRVQRLDDKNVGFQKYPPMAEVGKTQNTDFAYQLARKMGKELHDIGIDMDFAPVLDILSNPKNSAIGERAFGTDSTTVTKMALAYAKGLKDEKIIAVGKHFPGHGGTFKDSHKDLPFIEKDKEGLIQLELIPFIEAIRQNIPGIMVGHIAVPNVAEKIKDKNNEDITSPASLSKVMISDMLRESHNYKGLIIPDSLQMAALSKYFTNENIYLRCVQAGNDIMLMPQDINEAFNTIYRAVNEGKISEERINQSVLRILSTKFDYGLLDKEYASYLSTIKSNITR